MTSPRRASYKDQNQNSYIKLVESMQGRSPNLSYFYKELKRQYHSRPEDAEIGRAGLYEFDDRGLRGIPKRFFNATDFRDHVANLSSAGRGQSPVRRLFVLEDIVANYVEVIGKNLCIDPSVFAEHLRDTTYTESPYKSNGSKLPSSYKPGQSFSIVYYELLRDLPPRSQLFGQIFCYSNVYRKIKASDDRIGIVARKATFWSRGGGNAWDALLLLDPPVRYVTDNPLGSYSNIVELSKGPPKRYQNGYIDFMPWPKNPANFQELMNFAADGPKRWSAINDFEYYWKTYPRGTPDLSPYDSTRFIRKIVVANWMLLLEYLQRNYLKSDFERNMQQYRKFCNVSKLQAHQHAMQGQQIMLNTWIRRWTGVYPENVRSAMRRLNLQSPEECRDRMDEYEDWSYILARMTDLASSLIRTSDNITTHLDWVDSQLTQQQSRDINRLTWLGAVFLPLSFTCSILSLGGDFGPGDDLFWVYFVVAVPFTLFVALMVMPNAMRERAKQKAQDQLDRVEQSRRYAPVDSVAPKDWELT